MVRTFVSLKTVIEKVYRDNGINEELPFDSCVEWCAEALFFIGAFSQFEVKTEKLTVANNKASIPCNFINLIEISHNNLPMYYKGKGLTANYFCEDCKVNLYYNGCEGYFFYFQGTNIITSFTEGEICITYTAIPIDEENYPMIPDDEYYKKACASYITQNLDRIEWRKGKISDKVYLASRDDWDWYCSAARGSANLPDLAGLENLKNVIVRLIPAQNSYQSFFPTGREQKRIH